MSEPKAISEITSKVLDNLPKSAEEADYRATKENVIIAELGKLALIYWRPDFTPSQAKLLYSMFLDDLAGLSIAAIRRACASYRTDGRNKFFPTPGQLIDELLSPHDPSVTDRERTRQRERLELHRESRSELLRFTQEKRAGTAGVIAIPAL